jgi:PTS system nitrogen regulatory IIA component
MDIKELLAPAHALVDVRADDKTGLLEQLAERAATARNVAAERVSSELLKREQLGSTGVGGGVAIPHARLPELKRPFGVLARLRRAVDFESIDGQPVDLVFMLLLPTASAGEHLNALAAAARKLRDPGVLAQLRRASDGAALYQAMAGPSSN